MLLAPRAHAVMSTYAPCNWPSAVTVSPVTLVIYLTV